MRFPDLANTFRALVKEGKDGFYKGRIAEVIRIPFASTTTSTLLLGNRHLGP
jgi:gamma-glutamyltranspeptidase